MDRWDVLIACVAGYIALVSLVRLMTRRRNRLVSQLQSQIAKNRGIEESASIPKVEQHSKPDNRGAA